MTADEVEKTRESGLYSPWAILEGDPALKRALGALVDGTLGTGDNFRELYDSLVYGVEGNTPDDYFVLKDFASYREVRGKAGEVWKDSGKWNRIALLNIAGSGRFSSDRTIRQYASDIWGIKARR